MTEIRGAKPWRTGRGIVITLPAVYIKNGLLDVNKRYDVVLEEAKDAKAIKEAASSASDTSGLFSMVSGSGNFPLFSQLLSDTFIYYPLQTGVGCFAAVGATGYG